MASLNEGMGQEVTSMSNQSICSVHRQASGLAVNLFLFYWILLFGGLVPNPFSGHEASSFVRYHVFALLFAYLVALLDLRGFPGPTKAPGGDGRREPERTLPLRKAMLGALAFVLAVAGLLLAVAAVNWIFGVQGPFRIDQPAIAGVLLLIGLVAGLGSYFTVRRIRNRLRDSRS
jgi:hypothetical protein